MNAGDGKDRLFLPVLGSLLLAGGALRVLGLFNDFWLDEILSYRQALSLPSPLDILSADLPVSSTPLNTLFLRAMGIQRHWVPYRLLSAATGIGSVALMGCIGRWFGRRTAVAATVAGTANYLLVLYSSEALGYSPAVFFSLASVLLGRALFPGGEAWRLALYWLSALLGLLSHPAYVFAFAGLLAWHFLAFLRQGSGTGNALFRTLRTDGPIALFACSYLWWVHGKQSYGGPAHSPMTALTEAISFTFGLPLHASWHVHLALAAGACAAVLFLAEILRLRKDGDPFWAFLAATVVLAPAAAIAILSPKTFYPRYFIVCVPFLLLTISLRPARWWGKGGWHRVAAAGILALYCAGNLAHVSGLLRFGRGGYSEALRFMESRSGRKPTFVASNDDWRCAVTLSFYVRALSLPPVRLQRIAGDLGQVESEWFILSSAEPPGDLPAAALFPGGNVFELVRKFPSCSLSGFWWALYRASDAPEARRNAVPLAFQEDNRIGVQSLPTGILPVPGQEPLQKP